jgi:hypothetical protein
MADCVIHWFRRDLRLDDNCALDAARRSGDPVLPVFILDDAILARPIEAGRLSFLRTALEDLDEQLRRRGSGLLVRQGDAARELNHVAEEAGAWGVYLNRDHTPYARQRDARATRGLQMTGVVTQTFDDLLLVSPQLMVDSAGLPPTTLDDFTRLWLERLDLDPQPPAAVEGTFLASGDLQSSDHWADALAPTPGGQESQAGGQDTLAGATADSARVSLAALLTRLHSLARRSGRRLRSARYPCARLRARSWLGPRPTNRAAGERRPSFSISAAGSTHTIDSTPSPSSSGRPGPRVTTCVNGSWLSPNLSPRGSHSGARRTYCVFLRRGPVLRAPGLIDGRPAG